MNNNDILRRIRFALDLSNQECIKLCCLNTDLGVVLGLDEVKNKMAKESDENFVECSDVELSAFLEGLIISKRGPKPTSQNAEKKLKPVTEDFQLSKNDVLRKLRIALTLQETDMLNILKQGGSTLSKSELSAFFRNPQHKHYRKCGTQVLRNFLKGLTLTLRGDNLPAKGV